MAAVLRYSYSGGRSSVAAVTPELLEPMQLLYTRGCSATPDRQNAEEAR